MSGVTLILFLAAYLVFSLKLERSGPILLLLLILLIAKKESASIAVGGAVVAAALISFLFFPPVGSLWIDSWDDRLALALFLLSALVGSVSIDDRKNDVQCVS
jgi:K+-sensing histidine kinase KdpD